MPISLGLFEWGCQYHRNSDGKRTENLSPQPPAVFFLIKETFQSPQQGESPQEVLDEPVTILFAVRVLFLVSLVIDLCCLTVVEERW